MERDGIWIQPSQDPDTGAPVCIVSWDEKAKAISTDDAFATARDLMAAAAYAETDKALVEELTDPRGGGLDLRGAGALLARVRERRVPAPGRGRPALRIEAIYGANTGAALVHVGLGSHKGELDPAEARQMAQHWTETAVAALLDARSRYVLRTEFDFDQAQTERFFDQLQAIHLRSEGYS